MTSTPPASAPSADQLLQLAQGRVPANRSSAELVSRVLETMLARPVGPYPLVVGISGAQGSGKSTISEFIALALKELCGQTVAVLSLDDFYLPKAQREALGRSVHPLCATRGVPGTHEVSLLLETISRLLVALPGQTIRWPLFDKLADDRAAEPAWNTQTGRPDAILLEGWCVALPADRVAPWRGPINQLEAEADPQGAWISWSLEELRAHYAVLWKLLDLTVGIRLPDIETVVASRLLQEQRMQQARPSAASMDEAGVRRFVQHYERFTLALWDALPTVADIMATRDADFTYRIASGDASAKD